MILLSSWLQWCLLLGLGIEVLCWWHRKAMCSGVGDDDACVCCFTLERIVVGPLVMSWLRVKTLVRLLGLNGSGAWHHHLLKASL